MRCAQWRFPATVGTTKKPSFQKMNLMSDKKSTLEELISGLKQERDELKLKLHLAGMEAKDEYERISGKIDELTEQYEPVSEAVEETAGNVWSALSMVADELKAGYQRVRNAMDEN